MRARQAEAAADARAQLVASGLGYVAFAEGSPALFPLMFGSERTRRATPGLVEAGEAAFHVLTDGVAVAARGVAVRGRGRDGERDRLLEPSARLRRAGARRRLPGLDDPGAREAVLRQAIERTIG